MTADDLAEWFRSVRFGYEAEGVSEMHNDPIPYEYPKCETCGEPMTERVGDFWWHKGGANTCIRVLKAERAALLAVLTELVETVESIPYVKYESNLGDTYCADCNVLLVRGPNTPLVHEEYCHWHAIERAIEKARALVGSGEEAEGAGTRQARIRVLISEQGNM